MGGSRPIPDTITTPPTALLDVPTDLRPTKIVRGLDEIPGVMKDVLANGVKPGEGGFNRPLVDDLGELFKYRPSDRMYVF